MQRLFCVFLIIVLVSCERKAGEKSEEIYAEIHISIDTVMVDSGNEILMAATGSYGHVISSDLDRLYYWDPNSSKLEIIDLDEFQLLEKISFEKEGPNGVGQYANTLSTYREDQLAFIGWDDRIAISSLDGEVIQRIKLDEPWMVEDFEDNGSLSFKGFSEDGKKIYCGFLNFKKLDSDILELDLENQTKKVLRLAEFDKLDQFRVSWTSDDGNAMSMSHPSLDITTWNGHKLIYTNILNSVYRYDPQRDSLQLLSYSSSLTPNEKSGTYKNDVSTQNEVQEISAKIREEVNFTQLVWDKENEVFYRFTYFLLPKVADEQTKQRSFISILNADLELIKEKEITELGFKFPNPQFVKEGKIYFPLNLEDELAYVRMQIE
ncbi:DUF4221 family protein [Pararhodonellum marinum]|uniref:DUF4221 family protein n=1 Tax=Pararhodonellum marinum TaxID=2755358 RepID=UPI00188DDC5A|nr:DUF4221 family protein [Pararhodonellum marinum]